MKKLSFLALLSTLLFSNEVEILSDTRQDIIQLQKKQIIEKKKVNQYDWLSNINLNASISNTQDTTNTQDYSLSFSQDIFKFGGINAQIKYAKEFKKLQDLDLTITTKEDLNTLYTYLLDIQLNEISLEQNILNIHNAQIDIIQKKSEYKAGELSISDLNDAMMTKNNLRETYETLLLEKEKNINNLKQYTHKKYTDITLPKLQLITQDDFLANSTAIQYADLNTQVNNLSYTLKKSDYLPTVSFDTQYGYAKSQDISGDDYYKYGVSISVPLSFTSSNDITYSKLQYLTSKKELEQEHNDAMALYDEVVLSIKSYQSKITLAQEDITLYNELLTINEQEYQAGYKTLDDVDILKNSRMIRTLDIKSYRLNIQKLLLSLYSQQR